MELLFGSFTLLVVLIVRPCQTQECPPIQRVDLEGSGGLLTDAISTATTTTLTAPVNVVCLASGTVRDNYRFASVFVTFTRDNEELIERGQLDLECNGGSGSWSQSGIDLSPSANASTPLRRDCASCVQVSNDPDFDSVTHCVPCFGCFGGGLNQCTSPTPLSATCCNFYNNDTCTTQCPQGTGADVATDFACIDPCSPNPCANGATCSPMLAESVDVICSCTGSWEGPLCQSCGISDCMMCSQMRDICSRCNVGYDLLSGVCVCPLLCKNGGELLSSQCSCNCTQGFSGPTCEETSGAPLQCGVNNCRICSTNSAGLCEECEQGYQPRDEGTRNICKKDNPLSVGAIVGIVIGGGVLVLGLLTVVIIVTIICCCKKDNTYV